MPKRRRLLINDSNERGDVVFARGRLKGALMSALDPSSEDESSNEGSPVKRERRDLNNELSNDDAKSSSKKGGATPVKSSNSYVMKLFDRSVDLAQFNDDTPLYPICRAWMANQPRTYGREKTDEPDEEAQEELVGLPPPKGPVHSKVPPLLLEQCQFLKEAINFDYHKHTPPSIDHLMELHRLRWAAVRKKWQKQAALYEARYFHSAAILKEMDASA